MKRKLLFLLILTTAVISLAAQTDVEEAPKNQAALKRPRAFSRDLEESPAHVDDYKLILIVRGPFAERNWEHTADELVNYLTEPRESESEARARFYLGQCYYFLGEPWYGMFEFFAIHDRFPCETSEWIKASVDMMND